MNNRIEKLAAEAEEYAEFYSAIADETEFSIFKRRFAELLIAECATVVSIAVDHREPASTYFSKVYDHFYSENYIVEPPENYIAEPTEYDEWRDFDQEC